MATSAKDGKPSTRAKAPPRRKAASATKAKAPSKAKAAAPAPAKVEARPVAAKPTPAAPKVEAKPAAPAPKADATKPAATASGVASEIKAAAARAIAAAEIPGAIREVAAKVTPAKTSAAKPKAPARKAATPAKPRKAAAARAKSAAKPSGRTVGAGAVLGVAAAGLAAGIVANLGRKAAVQAPSVMAGDWLEALKGEHKAALALIDQLAATSEKQVAKRALLLAQLRHALGRHAFTEENVIYTALREWGDKADADALNHEQGYHKQYLYELDGLAKGAPEFAFRLADFRKDLEAHIREEEEKIFPKLHQGLSEDKNKALTALANREGFKLA